MDLNELLSAHQMAVIKAAAPDSCARLRRWHVREACLLAVRIGQMPGSLAIFWPGAPAMIARHPGNAGRSRESLAPPSSNNAAALAIWESEGGAAGSGLNPAQV